RSGVAGCSPSTTLADDGAAQTVSGVAVDNAGNSSSGTATVSIDQVKPAISATRDRDPNANGWYNDDVTGSFSCADPLSGIASCTGPQTFDEGAAQAAHGLAVDLADNSAVVTDAGINVDKTAPTLTGAPTSTPNADGWYGNDVTIHWTCGDALS